ncbi:MAG: hypothetical protein CMJ41_01010 [Phycisphaerae bacterium]|nr:hypothetical protein [Phycisphaerae bacterium]
MRDLHLANARIWTGDPAHPVAKSMLIRNGRVAALDAPAGDIQSIDCRGDVVTPGLIDAHLHLLLGGSSLETLDLSTVTSRAEFEARIEGALPTLPPDAWLLAHGWSQDNWGGQLPTDEWLRGAGDRPVVCWRMDWHAALVNEPVLRICDLPDDATLESEGGRHVRCGNGTATGLLLENAAWKYVQSNIPAPSIERRRAHLLEAQRHAHRMGLTGVRTMEYARDLHSVYVPLQSDLTLRCSVVLLDRELPLDLAWIPSFDHDEHLFISGCKTFIDGTIGSRSARLRDDWADRPGDRGMLVELALEQQLLPWLDSVHSAGLDAAAHAIGDEAVGLVLDLHERSQSGRVTLEHGEVVDPDDLARCRGVWFSMQPLHRADDARSATAALGAERAGWLAPFRSLRDAGARFAFGSDWPIVTCDPMAGIHSATTGLTIDDTPFHPEQTISVEEALVAYTRDAAECCRFTDGGVLRPGAHGDCVRWNGDPLAELWDNERPSPHLTISAGEVVYDASSEQP